MTTAIVAAYLVVGVGCVAAWNYYRPWSEFNLYSPAPIGAALAWPLTVVIFAACVARERGVARRRRMEDARRQAEIDAREVERILRADGAR